MAQILSNLLSPKPDEATQRDLDRIFVDSSQGLKPHHYFHPQVITAIGEREVKLKAFNGSGASDRVTKAKDLFKEVGKGSLVVPPLWVEWVNRSYITTFNSLSTYNLLRLLSWT